MLQLNLLSREAKQALAYERYRRAVLTFGSGALAALAIFLILLIPSYFFITFEIRELNRSLTLEAESEEQTKLRELGALIAEVKQLARRIQAGAANRRTVSPLLAEVIASLPKAVTLSSLRFDAGSAGLSLAGQAATRADFLLALAALRAQPGLTDVTSPVTNIIRERDIDFTLNATLR